MSNEDGLEDTEVFDVKAMLLEYSEWRISTENDTQQWIKLKVCDR